VEIEGDEIDVDPAVVEGGGSGPGVNKRTIVTPPP